MPLDGLHRIGRKPAPGGEHLGKPVLRDRVAFARRPLQQRRSGGLVPGNAGAVEQCDGAFDLRVGVIGGGRRREPARRLDRVLGNAAPFLVQRAERVLGLRAAGLSGAAEQFGGTREILRE